MLSKKKIIFIIIIGIIVCLLTGSFIATDCFALLFNFKQDYSPVAKLTCSFLCIILALGIGKNYITRKDAILLQIALPFCFLGDIFVTINNYWYSNPVVFAAGGILFIIAVTLLILRHSQFFIFLKEHTLSRILIGLLFYSLIIIIVVVFYRQLIEKELLLLTIIYGSFVMVSLWTAWTVVFYKLYNPVNAWIIAIGMTSFFGMELTGQFYNLKLPYLTDIGFVLSWTFYVPALVLLALSGYNWKVNKKQETL